MTGHRAPVPRPSAADAALIAAHLEWMRQRGLTARTRYSRERDLIRLAAALAAPLGRATRDQLAAWRAGLACGPSAANGAAVSASQFYGWLATVQQARQDNPAARLTRCRLPRRLPRPITESALMAALAAAPPRIRIYLVLAAWAGLRAKEIALLRRECVLDQAPVPALLIAADATKGHRERIVPMCPFVAAELAAYGLPPSGWIFPRADGKPGPNRPARISQACNAHLHDRGITATLHQLRHRFGTQAYHSTGKDIRAVQELMGHADPATTAGYAAFDQESAAAALALLPVPPGSPAGKLRLIDQAS